MNRKNFLSSIVAAGAVIPELGAGIREKQSRQSPTIPEYLQPGDMIGITCPAGNMSLLEIQPAMQEIESWGFKIKIGDTIGKKDFTFGGTDEERAKDFQQMLDDPELKAILSARGGYGSVRIIDLLRWEKFVARPKWIIGFSDITIIHCHLNRNFNIASLHSKMCNSFPEDWSKAEPIQVETILSIKQALTGEKMKYPVIPDEKNKTGTAEGQLIGGNLKTIETLSGTGSDIRTEGKILFVEDTGEYLYSIDRMFWNLKRTGKLDHLEGLIICGFKVKPDDLGEEFGITLEDIVLEKLKQYNYPVCFNFPVGHQKDNFALKCGVNHRLEVQDDQVILSEIA
jgi:muramoyltetrapeptide carboxypeptidase